MKTGFVSSLIIALSLGIWAGATPAAAQTPPCPPGYYYASDGRCYPGAPPAYPPPPYPVYPAPVYEVAPPVYAPYPVYDGFYPGIGVGVVIGGPVGRVGVYRGGVRGGGHR